MSVAEEGAESVEVCVLCGVVVVSVGVCASVAVWVSVTGDEVVSEDICSFPCPVVIVQLPCPGHRFTGSPECVLPNSIYQLDSTEGS